MIRTIKDEKRAPLNRTLTLGKEDIGRLKTKIVALTNKVKIAEMTNKTIHQDIFEAVEYLPAKFVDVLFIDPPYNLDKEFNSNKFKKMTSAEYEVWIDSWLKPLLKILKPSASIYICGDWRSASAIFNVMSKYFIVRNRITWEREKGRGAKHNWKNCSEDIWYGTMSDKFTFHSDKVMLKRKVIAPYRDENGKPKDWVQEEDGDYRLTYPSNLWTDITVPFWSMPENTDHPTQKPEKLLAKIILASSNDGDFVFDPFLGSGTTSVVAKKLGRRYCGVEIDPLYCCLTEKRLEMAEHDRSIQGYVDDVFWERNTITNGKKIKAIEKGRFTQSESLFPSIRI
ncbi:MAG: DNA methylase [Planctomycetes bacterium RBG_16_43_13]|nr:MAG: DNA methylase [Planctomycetes bacterium RBG_16_43_13]